MKVSLFCERFEIFSFSEQKEHKLNAIEKETEDRSGRIVQQRDIEYNIVEIEIESLE